MSINPPNETPIGDPPINELESDDSTEQADWDDQDDEGEEDDEC